MILFSPAGAMSQVPIRSDNIRLAGIFLHVAQNTYLLEEIHLQDSATALSATLNELPSPPKGPRLEMADSGTTPRGKTLADSIWEVHLYVKSPSPVGRELQVLPNEKLQFPLSALDSLAIYDRATGAWLAPYVFSGAPLTPGLQGLLALFTEAAKGRLVISSPAFRDAPSLFGYAGDKAVYLGEFFGGRAQPFLHREDLLPLRVVDPDRDEYVFCLANLTPAIQHLDGVRLCIVYHDDFTEAGIDQAGAVRILYKPEPPTRATSGRERDVTELLVAPDHRQYLFDEDSRGVRGTPSLQLVFRKPSGASSGKLLLHLRSTPWLEEVYSRYAALWGEDYPDKLAGLAKMPASERLDWLRAQGIALSVYQGSGPADVLLASLLPTGSGASRELVLTMDVSGLSGDQVEIRLECAFLAWAVDYAAVDFSADLAFKRKEIPLSMASDQDGTDLTEKLMIPDSLTVQLDAPGEKCWLSFRAPPAVPGYTRSAFLGVSGYSAPSEQWAGAPDSKALKAYQKAGAIDHLSHQVFGILTGAQTAKEPRITPRD